MVECQSEPGLDVAFAALADPTRREILDRLRAGPATVGQLARPFAMSLNGVSKHVRVLERAGLVERQVRGREHRLSLRAAPLRDVARFAAGYASFWDQRLDALERLLSTEAGT